MRLTVVCASLLLAFIPQAAAKAPPGPIDVYLDFAGNGHLTKHYPNALLRAIVNDASLNQYGDPLLMMRLRRAARLQLAGAPVVSASQPSPSEGTTSTPRQGGPSTTKGGGTGSPHAPRSGHKAQPPSQTSPSTASGQGSGTTTAAAEPLIDAKTLVIIAAIIVLAVGALRVASAKSRKRT
jgi:hypothetical protein